MPRSRDLARYPAACFGLLERFAGASQVDVPCPSEQSAKHIRGLLYSFQIALKRNHHPLAEAAARCIMTITPQADGTAILHLRTPEFSPIQKILEGAIGVPSNAEASLAALLDKVRGGPNGKP